MSFDRSRRRSHNSHASFTKRLHISLFLSWPLNRARINSRSRHHNRAVTLATYISPRCYVCANYRFASHDRQPQQLLSACFPLVTLNFDLCMTLAVESDKDDFKMKQRAKYMVRDHLVLKLLSGHTHPDRSLYLDHLSSRNKLHSHLHICRRFIKPCIVATRRYASAVYTVIVCLSVCLSVTSWYCTKG